MKQLLLAAIKCKGNSNSSGFSLLEALVGILVITTFTLTALQALVLATTFRVRAEQESGATNWIQEQLEEAKFQAFQLDLDFNGPGDGSGTADNNDGTDDDGNGSDIDVNPGRCQATSADSGYADALETNLPPSTGATDISIGDFTGDVIDRTNEFPGPEMVLLRNTNPSDDEPFQVLELEYIAVLDRDQSDDNLSTTTPDENDIVAELYTEVIPDEAFACN